MALGRLFTIAANYSGPDACLLGGVVEATPEFRAWFVARAREHLLLREERARVAELALDPDLDMAGASGSALAALAAARLGETSSRCPPHSRSPIGCQGQVVEDVVDRPLVFRQ
jgi:hypothetical protein